MQHINTFQADTLGHLGWKYYNTIKKKAMEQEFSWSGLIISLSIAFFIVLACAQALSLAYQSITANERQQNLSEQRIYRLESFRHINTQTMENINIQFNNIKHLTV